MKIHEYQAKELLRQHQVAVPQGGVARTAEEAEKKDDDDEDLDGETAEDVRILREVRQEVGQLQQARLE